MVINFHHPVTHQRMEISNCRSPDKFSLTFGIDRILSREPIKIISPPNNYRDGFENEVPCMMLRCHSPCDPRFFPVPIRVPHTSFVSRSVCVPQPLRPYSNVVLQAESHTGQCITSGSQQKRKRSWSRAVFSNLQRKGLEKRFQLQKYITKPDRRQLAATLGLTDAQVKVWFQNRRMKWRHAKEGSREESKDLSQNFTLPSLPNKMQRRKVPRRKSNCPSSDSESDVDIQTVEID